MPRRNAKREDGSPVIVNRNGAGLLEGPSLAGFFVLVLVLVLDFTIRGRRRGREARAADCFAPAPIAVCLRECASREVGQRRPRRAAGQRRGEGFRVRGSGFRSLSLSLSRSLSTMIGTMIMTTMGERQRSRQGSRQRWGPTTITTTITTTIAAGGPARFPRPNSVQKQVTKIQVKCHSCPWPETNGCAIVLIHDR